MFRVGTKSTSSVQFQGCAAVPLPLKLPDRNLILLLGGATRLLGGAPELARRGLVADGYAVEYC